MIDEALNKIASLEAEKVLLLDALRKIGGWVSSLYLRIDVQPGPSLQLPCCYCLCCLPRYGRRYDCGDMP